MLRDRPPSGDRRPALPPRFIVLSMERIGVPLPEGTYGVFSQELLQDLSDILRKIKEPESHSLAVATLSLSNDLNARTEAVRKLFSRKDASTYDFLTYLINDSMLHRDIRAEAMLALGALGDKRSLPFLVQGAVDDDEKVRMGAARALSLYKEVDTLEQVQNTLKTLDVVRLRPVLQTVSNSGWKPISAIVSLSVSSDPHVANIGIRLLGAVKDPKSTDQLLKLFDEPGQGNFSMIIDSLGASGDKRAVAPLHQMAADRAERIGFEVVLANALASLGDQTAAPLIEDMINNSKRLKGKLRAAYKKLTGKDYNK